MRRLPNSRTADASGLKELLRQGGASLAGIGDVTPALSRELLHLNRAVAIAVNRGLNRATIDLLARLQGFAEGWLKEQGFRSLSIPADSDRRTATCVSKLYARVCHKTAATCSGLGWIGKNGLVINRRFGSRLSWATVLTDAPLPADRPVTESECGDCDLCVRSCPSHALTGQVWSREDPLQEVVSYDRCRSHKGRSRGFDEKPNCGLCVTICPYSRRNQGH